MNVAGYNMKLIPELSFSHNALNCPTVLHSLNQWHSMNQPKTKISVGDINRCLKFPKGDERLEN